MSVVGANYGLGYRNLGHRRRASGRCAWTTRRRSPRFAMRPASSRASSRRSTKAERREARLLRGPRRRPGRRATPRSRRRSAASPASCIRTSTSTIPRPRRSSRRRRRPTRCSPIPTAAAPTTRSATRACAPGGWAPRADGFGELRGRAVGVLRPRRPAVRRPVRVRPGGPGQRRRRRRPGRADPRGGPHRRQARGRPSRRCRRASAAGATAPSPERRFGTCETCGGSGRAPRGGANRLRSAGSIGRLPDLRGPGTGSRDSPARSATARAGPCATRTWEVEVPAGIESGQRIRIAGAGHAGEAAGRAGDLYVEVRGGRGRALRAPRPGPGHRRSRCPRRGRCSAATATVATLDGEREVEVPAGAQPGEHVVAARASACRRSAARRRGDEHVVLDVYVPDKLTRSSASWSSGWTSRSARRAAGETGGRAGAAARRRRLIRLAVRCRPELAERVLAELVELAPGRGRGGCAAPGTSSTRSTARRASCPRSPTSRRWPATAWWRSPRPRSRTTGPTAGRTSTGRSWSAARLWVRPSWEEPRPDAIDVVVDPGQAFGTGAHPTTRMCLELLLELWPTRATRAAPLADWGTGSGVLAIAAAKLGFGPVAGLRPRAGGARGRRGERRRERRRARARARVNLREAPRRWRRHRGRQPDRAAAARGRRRGSSEVPQRLICSGLLASEADRVADAFAERGLIERRASPPDEWTAIYLTAPTAAGTTTVR